MKMSTIENMGQIDGARSFFLFFFSRSAPVVAILYVLILAYVKELVFGWHLQDAIILVCILFLRGYAEWAIHYYLMHARPLPLFGARLKGHIYHMHMQHHLSPDDSGGVLFRTSSVMFALTSAFFGLLPFSLEVSLVVTIALALCLLIYEVFHVLSHSAIKSTIPLLMKILNAHRSHHRVSDNYFGVSSLLGDRTFGTNGLIE